MSHAQSQLPLLVKLRDQAVFESYFSGPNADVVAQLGNYPTLDGGVVWLWGEDATGKSHLLQAVCSAAERAAYLPAGEIRNLGVGMLAGFGKFSLLCLDDLDALMEGGDFESALFSLFQELVTEGRNTLVVSTTCAPRDLDIALPDLKSRLLSGPVYRLVPLSEDERLEAVILRAERRGLELPEKTGRFLLRHFKRDMRSLCDMLDKMDTASLVQQQRRLTIPLAKNALSTHGPA